MYKVRTSVDSKEKAKEIATKLINHKVAVSVHIREANSMHQWEGDCLQQSMNLLSILEDWLSECESLLHSSISPCDSCEYLDQCNNCDGDPECIKSSH